MSLQWSEALSIGVEAIDAQHKELINRINGLLPDKLLGTFLKTKL